MHGRARRPIHVICTAVVFLGRARRPALHPTYILGGYLPAAPDQRARVGTRLALKQRRPAALGCTLAKRSSSTTAGGGGGGGGGLLLPRHCRSSRRRRVPRARRRHCRRRRRRRRCLRPPAGEPTRCSFLRQCRPARRRPARRHLPLPGSGSPRIANLISTTPISTNLICAALGLRLGDQIRCEARARGAHLVRVRVRVRSRGRGRVRVRVWGPWCSPVGWTVWAAQTRSDLYR